MDPALMTPAMDGQAQMPANQANMFQQAPNAYMGVNTPPGNMPL